MHRSFVVILCGVWICISAVSLVHCNNQLKVVDAGIKDDLPGPDTGTSFSLAFPLVALPMCVCRTGEKYASPHSPEIQEQAEALAVSPNGRVLVVALKLKVIFYERTNSNALFKAQAKQAVLPQLVWRVRFSPDSRHVALVLDRQVQVWSVEKALEDPSTASVLQVDSPGDGSASAADAVFLDKSTLAVAFFQGKEKDPIQVWSFAGASPKQVMALDAPAVQSLVVPTAGNYLIAGGREVSGDAPKALFTVFQWTGAGASMNLVGRKTFLLPQKKSNVTTMAISPDNQYLALGTSPDLTVQRGAPKPPPAGDHGSIMIWSTTPLTPDAGIPLISEKERGKAHNILVRRLAFRADGRVLGSLGIGSPRTGALLHLWKRQDDKAAPFVLADSLKPATPGRDMGFDGSCQFILNTSFVEPYLQMWKGCL